MRGVPLTGAVGRGERGLPHRRQGAVVLLDLVHAHGTVPHGVLVVVDGGRAAAEEENTG